jgi:hypothetical protein
VGGSDRRQIIEVAMRLFSRQGFQGTKTRATLPVLNRARNVLFLAAGAEKREVLQQSATIQKGRRVVTRQPWSARRDTFAGSSTRRHGADRLGWLLACSINESLWQKGPFSPLRGWPPLRG